jgi:uncharacterized protein YcfJ
MSLNMDNEANKPKIHPLAVVTAIAIILVCITGIAAMLGLLPNFKKASEESSTVLRPAAGLVESEQPKPHSVHEATQKPYVAPVKKPVVKKPTVAVNNPSAPLPIPPCVNCGVVESVRVIQQQAPTSGVGAAAGAVLGGVLGNQVGGGNGKTLAAIAGAVGGGIAGNAIERNTHTKTVYEVTVYMENGSRQSFMMNEQRWRSGDLVRVENGYLMAR